MEKVERRSMAKYIVNYLKYVDENMSEANDNFISEHLIKISFFQHERIIHLIVTVTAVIINLFAFFLGYIFSNIVVIFFGYMVMCFTIPYIYHYFLLENGVQKMYRQYDNMKNK